MNAPDPRQLRRLLALGVVLASLALLWLLFGATRSALSLWHELDGLPDFLRYALLALVTVFAGASAWLAWRLLNPRPRKPRPSPPVDRASVEQRLERLQSRQAETAQFEAELQELDRRARSETAYVAVFGEISAGKSSLVRALAPQARDAIDVDVIGGTTRLVSHHEGRLGERALILADVPGTREVGAREREQLARDEALRAHAVIYVAGGDLTRAQDAELRWLRGYGKPLLLVLNKTDQFDTAQREELLAALRRRYADCADRVVAVRAGGSEQFLRILPDGRQEQVTRQAQPEIAPLQQALAGCLAADPAELEQARAAAVLGRLDERLGQAERNLRERESQAIVDRHTRRAIVGALAAVAPGTDLLIQGALATSLIRELAALHDIPLRQIDLDAFLRQAALTLRTTSSVILAIAGNALKAFPGLGTLGGGVLHAVAYGLIFDSLGRAVSQTLLEQHRFDQEQAQAGLQRLLSEQARSRIGYVAKLALQGLREEETGAERPR
ncbi:GTPase [Tahibacter harae]|uniref:50S ribosome-binding GTPase n=1 Tax=Tahibacter harae TaxID=2963937 RepID=A0ABT1QSH7_9GAMM|nr:GTPase [Tahibacter harae]MCQ4165245.1 50S ribosome-binding GTPase [Tahibacter harae]